MAIKSETVRDAKSALKSMSKRNEKKLTKADFVGSLIKEIHEKMEAGFSIAEICEELNKTLPEGERMKLNTFKTYVRRAREDAGIAPLRTWTRRAKKEGKSPAATTKDDYQKDAKVDSHSDFRDQSGEL